MHSDGKAKIHGANSVLEGLLARAEIIMETAHASENHPHST